MTMATTLLLAGCGLTPYRPTDYDVAVLSDDGSAQLASIATITESGGVRYEVSEAQLAIRAQPGSPSAVVESVAFAYFRPDGHEIPLVRPHTAQLSLEVPAGYVCADELCFGDAARTPARGEEVLSAPFQGMPFRVAEEIFLLDLEGAYAVAEIELVVGRQVLTLEVGPVLMTQEVVVEESDE